MRILPLLSIAMLSSLPGAKAQVPASGGGPQWIVGDWGSLAETNGYRPGLCKKMLVRYWLTDEGSVVRSAMIDVATGRQTYRRAMNVVNTSSASDGSPVVKLVDLTRDDLGNPVLFRIELTIAMLAHDMIDLQVHSLEPKPEGVIGDLLADVSNFLKRCPSQGNS